MTKPNNTANSDQILAQLLTTLSTENTSETTKIIVYLSTKTTLLSDQLSAVNQRLEFVIGRMEAIHSKHSHTTSLLVDRIKQLEAAQTPSPPTKDINVCCHGIVDCSACTEAHRGSLHECSQCNEAPPTNEGAVVCATYGCHEVIPADVARQSRIFMAKYCSKCRPPYWIVCDTINDYLEDEAPPTPPNPAHSKVCQHLTDKYPLMQCTCEAGLTESMNRPNPFADMFVAAPGVSETIEWTTHPNPEPLRHDQYYHNIKRTVYCPKCCEERGEHLSAQTTQPNPDYEQQMEQWYNYDPKYWNWIKGVGFVWKNGEIK